MDSHSAWKERGTHKDPLSKDLVVDEINKSSEVPGKVVSGHTTFLCRFSNTIQISPDQRSQRSDKENRKIPLNVLRHQDVNNSGTFQHCSRLQSKTGKGKISMALYRKGRAGTYDKNYI